LPAAINLGIKSLPESVEFVNWLGDDDLLCPDSITSATKALEGKDGIAMVFRACDYNDSRGKVVWKNSSGQWAVPLLRFGPDLIPQPGALFRRPVFNAVGGLDTKFGWAFDFDLFIRLSKAGKLKYLNQTLAQFRWHPESLSVEHRKRSVAEASQVRVSHLPAFLRAISIVWEYPVRQATLVAGKRLSAKSQPKARTQ
jgi:GT2 family glycosyltransferase